MNNKLFTQRVLSVLSEALEALEAPTHEANDYNCQDWPPNAGCAGCKGDILREQAARDVKELIIEGIET